MAGISLSDLPAEKWERFIDDLSGTDKIIRDYLAEIMFHRLDKTLLTFLQKSSILNTHTETLCNIVTEREDSGEILSRLFAINLFLVPLDNYCTTFRFHPFLKDILYSQLGASMSVSQQRNLFKKISLQYERDGQSMEALEAAER